MNPASSTDVKGRYIATGPEASRKKARSLPTPSQGILKINMEYPTLSTGEYFSAIHSDLALYPWYIGERDREPAMRSAFFIKFQGIARLPI